MSAEAPTKTKSRRTYLFVLLPVAGFVLLFALCQANLWNTISDELGGKGDLEVVCVMRELGSTAAESAKVSDLEENQEALKNAIKGTDMTFLACASSASTASNRVFYRIEVAREGVGDLSIIYVYRDGHVYVDSSMFTYKAWNDGLYDACAKMFGDDVKREKNES